MRGVAPYRSVLTHGFTVDAKGRKMSKSRGNVVAPQKVVNSLGADILRLWVAATDYRGEMSVSDEILKRTADAYRRMRNTDAFPARQPERLRSRPRMRAAGRDAGAGSLGRGAGAALAAGRCQRPTTTTNSIRSTSACTTSAWSIWAASIWISSRTGNTPRQADSVARRSAQTAMYHIAEAMVRWLAPILSFTAEEIWQAHPGPAQRIGVSGNLV